MSTYKKDIKATIINQIFRVLSGPLLLLLIPIYLTSIQQGYWYTFTSIAALAIFADLGFTNIVLQFAAHEFARLKFDKDCLIVGDEADIQRLASFFRFSMRWLCKIVVIVFPLIILGGYFFLESKGNQVVWKGAWILYSLSSVIVFINSIVLSFFEGCNSVAKIQLIRLKISIGMSIVSIFGLWFGANLYALAYSLLVSGLLGLFFIYKHFHVAITQFLRESPKYNYDWGPQFFALIWRYAVSWCSGYFIFQLFTPLAFIFHGPEFAGKIGISIAMWTAGYGIAMSWINAIIPRMNIYIENNEWNELDKMFQKGINRALLTMIIGGGTFLLIEYFLYDKLYVFSRVLPFWDMMIIYFCWIGQVYINSIAVYLRGHKKEPLMRISLIVAIYVSATTYTLANYYSNHYFMCGFLTSLVFWIPSVRNYFKKERLNHNAMKK